MGIFSQIFRLHWIQNQVHILHDIHLMCLCISRIADRKMYINLFMAYLLYLSVRMTCCHNLERGKVHLILARSQCLSSHAVDNEINRKGICTIYHVSQIIHDQNAKLQPIFTSAEVKVIYSRLYYPPPK